MSSAHTARTARASLYSIVLLVLIVAFGFLLRWWRIDQAPKGALIDELHFGYLAHSLAETGRDEHGAQWPIIFRGFGDQKLPAYAYALVPVVQLLGLSVLALRVPSVLAGTALIAAMYALARELQLGRKWSLVVAFLTATIPWAFFLSRIGFESNLGLFFFVLGLTGLLRGLRTQKIWWQVLGILSLALTWYSYIAYRPVTLVLVSGILALYVRSRWHSLKLFALFAVFVLPLFLPSVIGANATRFNQVGIIHDPGLPLEINENRTFCSMTLPSSLCYLVFNKPTLVFKKLLARELRAFSPQYLSTEGEDETFLTVERYGQLYGIFYPFFMYGLATLLLTPILPLKHRRLLLLGLLISPIPGLLAGEPQKVRLSPFLPFVVLTTTVGLAAIVQTLSSWVKYRQQLIAPLVIGGLALVTLWQTTEYVVTFVGVHSIKREAEYQSYLPDLNRFITTLPTDALVVIKPFYSDPLMFYAFYTNVDPAWYQKNAVLGPLEASGFQHTVELGQIWAYDYSIDTVACKAAERGLHGYLVTNEQLPYPTVYKGISSNGVHTYVYVYNAAVVQPDCLDTPVSTLR